MELKQLRRFLVIAETKNFHAAAEILNITQPALSQSIQKLEESVGELLFLRGSRGVELTDFGKLLLPRAKLILKFGDDFIYDVEEAQEKRNSHIRIGVSPYLARGIFIEAFNRFNQRMPDVLVDVIEEQGLKLTSAIEHGDLDMAFCALIGEESSHPSINFDQLYSVRYALCARDEHPIFTEKLDLPASLSQFPWAIHDRRTVGTFFAEKLGDEGLPPPLYTVESESVQIIMSIVCATDHIAFIGKDYAHPELSTGRLKEIEHSIKPFHDVETKGGVFTIKDAPRSKALSVLIQELENVCKEREGH